MTMTNEQPEQWVVELWRKAVFDYGGASIEDTPAEWRAVMAIQRAFAEREAVGQRCPSCGVKFQKVANVDEHLAALKSREAGHG